MRIENDVDNKKIASFATIRRCSAAHSICTKNCLWPWVWCYLTQLRRLGSWKCPTKIAIIINNPFNYTESS
jgi:hypothetical protein